jgi:hypothetical protein
MTFGVVELEVNDGSNCISFSYDSSSANQFALYDKVCTAEWFYTVCVIDLTTTTFSQSAGEN